jgi:hypothetical protein
MLQCIIIRSNSRQERVERVAANEGYGRVGGVRQFMQHTHTRYITGISLFRQLCIHTPLVCDTLQDGV